ncbi:hypothetical protein FSP39_018961 [Pinctada imbricata]|uniref:Uncharacterized protein n=1 Tax=Pinctada imbricata TaxID=66713 RepID=A0AA88YBT4_PINIB|nr:hypothetical protein FSP39_018961 [Pinctada imbricata]
MSTSQYTARNRQFRKSQTEGTQNKTKDKTGNKVNKKKPPPYGKKRTPNIGARLGAQEEPASSARTHRGLTMQRLCARTQHRQKHHVRPPPSRKTQLKSNIMTMMDNDVIMSSLCELLANRRIPNEIISKKAEPVEVDCEIRAEQTIEQIQRRMCLIQQEIHDMKVQLDLEKHGKETKIMRKIDMLKEQFRELLVEMRQRKAAEAESAVILSSDDDLDDEIDDDGEPRRPFRRRTLSISSRLSTVSQSSTVRPLAAAPSSAYEASETDSLSEASFRMDGISQVGRAAQYRRQYSEQPRQYRRENPATYQRQYSEQPKKFEILDYASSPSMERRYRTY